MTLDPILRRLARNPEYDRLCARLLSLLWERERAEFVPDDDPDVSDDLPPADSLTARFGCGSGALRPVPDFFGPERDEQVVVMEVCRLPGMTPAYWASLDPFSREPWLRRAVVELEQSSTLPDQPTRPPVSTLTATVPPPARGTVQADDVANPDVPEWLGNGKVRIGQEEIVLTVPEGLVLGVLVRRRAGTAKQLVTVEPTIKDEKQVGKMLEQIRRKYEGLAPFIRMAGKKGNGGYGTTIRNSALPAPY